MNSSSLTLGDKVGSSGRGLWNGCSGAVIGVDDDDDGSFVILPSSWLSVLSVSFGLFLVLVFIVAHCETTVRTVKSRGVRPTFSQKDAKVSFHSQR